MRILEVAPGLYRSSQPIIYTDFQIIENTNIDLVIDLENEDGEAYWEEEKDKCLNFPLSGFWAPKEAIVNKILNTIDEAIGQNKKVLVHCFHGHDRTGLICGLYLRRHKIMSKYEAWGYMCSTGFHPILLGLTWYYSRHA